MQKELDRTLSQKDLDACLNWLGRFISAQRKKRFKACLEQRTRVLTCVLEDFYQPHNASAVLRSCEAFGVQDVYVIEKKYQFLPTKGIEVGARQWLDLFYFRNEGSVQRCVRHLKKQNYQLVAAVPDPKAIAFESFDLKQKTALVFGTEKLGISDQLLSQTDAQVQIPMVGFTQSLNVSVAAALFLYQWTKKLRESLLPWRLSEVEKKELLLKWFLRTIRKSDLLLKKYAQEKNQSPHLPSFMEKY